MTTQPKRPGRRSRRGSQKGANPQHSSAPTSRLAYTETRLWLLEQHGAVCAYCGRAGTDRTMTLDHVTPRRGQTAYDRRDNLVLACKRCNAAKADKPFLVFLLAHRSRAECLLRYGRHLSAGILDLVRHMAGDTSNGTAPATAPQREYYGVSYDDDDSPYLDSPYKLSA